MPNAKILEEKKAAVEELSGKIKSAASGVLVKYQGITVEDDTKLRAELRKAGVEYTVIKNSILQRAVSTRISCRRSMDSTCSSFAKQAFRIASNRSFIPFADGISRPSFLDFRLFAGHCFYKFIHRPRIDPAVTDAESLDDVAAVLPAENAYGHIRELCLVRNLDLDCEDRFGLRRLDRAERRSL